MHKFTLLLKKDSRSIIAFAILSAILVTLLLLDFDKNLFSEIFHDICVYTREFVGYSTVFCILVLLFLIFSRYGNIRLGGEKAKPEYSNFSWFSCLVMAGMGIGLIFYSQEPLYHLFNNPYVGNVSGTPEEIAYSLTLYDWTFNVWALYGLLSIIIGYLYYNKGRALKLSSIFPGRTQEWFKNLIDVLMALGIVAGLTTSLGLGVSQLKSGIDYVFMTNVNPYLLMLIVGLVATWSVNSGLKRGVKWLSNLSSILVFILLVVISVLAYMNLNVSNTISYTLNGIGNFIRNYIHYNDYANTASDDWAAGWAVFYQLWYAAWTAFVAVFVAKISKGRTIRECAWGVVLFPAVFEAVWFGIFGSAGLPVKEQLYAAMQNNLPQSVFFFLHQLASGGGYVALSVLVMVVICFFFITSSDSSSYVVATILSDDKEVRSFNKIAWSLIQCVAAMILFYCGGLALIQSASVVLGLLVLAIIFLGTIVFLYILIRDEK